MNTDRSRGLGIDLVEVVLCIDTKRQRLDRRRGNTGGFVNESQKSSLSLTRPRLILFPATLAAGCLDRTRIASPVPQAYHVAARFSVPGCLVGTMHISGIDSSQWEGVAPARFAAPSE
jgi:hypothetical protein